VIIIKVVGFCLLKPNLIKLFIQRSLFMVKVKTFTSPLKIFHVHNELMSLDKEVNDFLESNKVKKVVSVSDSTTEIDGGTMGIIRVVTYEE
ncbi:MAG: hypothetical protein AAB013_02120, partial [Planctomycetota bacterium]